MKIDFKALQEQVKAAASRRSSGNVNRISGNTVLRLLPFKNPETGQLEIFKEFRQWQRKGGQKSFPIPHRGNWDEADLIERVSDSNAEDFPFRLQTTYLVNAFEVGKGKVGVWQVPTTVFQAIGDILLDEDYEHALDPKTGLGFRVNKEGSGLDTEYSVIVKPKAVPVTKEQMAACVDPLSVMTLPTLESQATATGVDVDDVFDESELEPVKSKKGKAPADDEEDEEEAPKPKKKAKTPPPDEEEDDEEDEEEEAPEPKKKAKAPPPDEDDEDGDEDDEDEEAPKAKKKASIDSLFPETSFKKGKKPPVDEDEEEDDDEDEEEEAPKAKKKTLSIRDVAQAAKKK